MIGWYVHHHGHGHANRATQVARHLAAPVVGLGSMPRPEGWPGTWVTLPADVVTDATDPTAGGVFHWAPLGVAGHRNRLADIAGLLRQEVSLMVVDVSAEVSLLARLMGVRTVVFGMRGDRRDRPHRAAYDSADLIIAPWPGLATEPTWPEHWLAKTCHVGAISRFDDCTVSPPEGHNRVLAMWGAGGSTVSPADFRAATLATPGWEWRIRIPGTRPSPDIWADLNWADVVITHAGQNAVAEVAAAERPAVVVAQPRPYDEQHATVAALRSLGCCVALDAWPAPEHWPSLLVHAQGFQAWDLWTSHGGAAQAARAIEGLLRP